MYFPLVGERVWVNGCPHEFTVVRADYSAHVAVLSPIVDKTQVRVCRFPELFPLDEFEAAQTRESMHESLMDILGSSKMLTQAGKAAIHDMHRTARQAEATIKKSQELIERTDKVIERWKSLGCKS